MGSELGRVLAERLKSEDVIGVGSGGTVEAALLEMGKRIARDALRVYALPTSFRSAQMAKQAGFVVLSSQVGANLAWAFDGADEVDSELRLIKGRGAAMLNEKIVARMALQQKKKFIVIVGEDKLVNKLGEKHPIPIEVIPEALPYVEKELVSLGATSVTLRKSSEKYGPLITEHNNCILDTKFPSISNQLDSMLKNITGVVETGLFVDFSPEVLIEKKDGVWRKVRDEKGVREEKV